MEPRVTSPEEFTHLLQAWAGGDAGALDRSVPVVYRELCRIAQRCMSGEKPG